MKVLLIRHALSKGNMANIVQGRQCMGLADLGKEQANKLSEYFNPGDINAIYSSDSPRAIQTAEPTAQKLEIEITTDPDLQEANFEVWEGLSYDEVRDKYPDEYLAWHEDFYVRPPWLESFKAHQTRIRRAITKPLSAHQPNDTIAVFTHGGSIKTQVGYFNNKLSGKDLAKLRTINCSLTLLEFNPTTNYENGKLVYYNKEVITALSLQPTEKIS